MPDFANNPFGALAEVREAAAVRRVRHDGLSAWLVTRFADVVAMSSEPRLSVDPTYATEDVRALPRHVAREALGLNRSMLFVDPPEHERLRRLASKAFSPRRVKTLRPI